MTRPRASAGAGRAPEEPHEGERAIAADLDALARRIRRAWASALERGDTEQVVRLVEACHAVQRAAAALRSDTLVPRSGARPGPEAN